jgi:pimeloyl-ACP methyl ester carboxylesterase
VQADLDALMARLEPGCRVWFTGHSLGGAAATLAAYRYREVAGGLYTFGSPLVGNERFARALTGALGARSVRYVNDHDVVTRVPPAPFAFPNGLFTHVDHGRWIDDAGAVSASPPGRPQFVRDIFGRPNVLLDIIDLHQLDLANLRPGRRQPTLPDGLADHTPLYYALHCWNDFVERFGS